MLHYAFYMKWHLQAETVEYYISNGEA